MNRQFALSCLRKLRPVAGYRRIKIQLSLIDEPMRAESREALACGIDIDDRIAAPRGLSRLARDSGPEIHHHLLVDADGDRRARLASLSKILRERVLNAFEPRIAVSMNLHSDSSLYNDGSPCGYRNLRAKLGPAAQAKFTSIQRPDPLSHFSGSCSES